MPGLAGRQRGNRAQRQPNAEPERPGCCLATLRPLPSCGI